MVSNLSSDVRRAADAFNKFCTSNHINKELRDKVNDYFSYKTISLKNVQDQEAFDLLSEAFRVELVCRTGWRSMRNLFFLDRHKFDKVKSDTILRNPDVN